MARRADLGNRFFLTWLDRQDAEQRLVDLCEVFTAELAVAYGARHLVQALPSEHFHWAKRVGLISPEEYEIFRNAMVLRNHIVVKEFDIVLRDINRHAGRLQPLVEELPARVEALDPPDLSNVRFLR